MKKIILFFLLITLTGCNYIELNNLSIIKSISIDYYDNEYIINAEIISQIEQNHNIKTKILKVNNQDLNKCFNELTKLSNKSIHYSHIDLLMVSSHLKKKQYQEIFTYFVNHKDFRNDFLVISADDAITILEKSNYDEMEQLMLNNRHPYLIRKSIEDVIKDFWERDEFTLSYFSYIDNSITYSGNLEYKHNRIERTNNE